MAITIDRETARTLQPRFDEAMELIRNEFHGLDADQQYRNAFARLLKPDPLGRVLMMGTDQRDLFVPLLRDTIAASVQAHGHALDIGCGDGQTFALVADALPAGVTVSFADPNTHYVEDYRAMLRRFAHLREGLALAAGFEEMDAAAQRRGERPPNDGGVDLALAVHMLYFLPNLPAALTRMARLLKPGGALFVVVADDADGYTARVLHAFVAAGGDTGDNAGRLAAATERRRLLATTGEGSGALLAVLHAALPGTRFTLQTVRQPSRLYGHTLADLVALATISDLSHVHGLSKFETACQMLRETPELVDLCIEEDGPRMGMWSVRQPQYVATLRRASD